MAESPLSLSDCELPWEEDVGLSEAPSLRAAPKQWRYRGIEDDAVKTEEEDEAIVDLPDDDDDDALQALVTSFIVDGWSALSMTNGC